MTSIAIIGTGIAGLGCGYLLHRDFDVTLFDGNTYAGGHSNTVTVDEGGTPVPIDTGFMVYNEKTYPNLTRLFAELEIETMPAPMSFGVQHIPSGIEYCGSSLNQLFAKRSNLLRPHFLRALRQIVRFNHESAEALSSDQYESFSLEQYARARGYDEDFLRLYLLPMCSAVWSTPFEEIRSFPIITLLRFFDNHGLLGGMSGHLAWRTVRGGARRYVEAMTSRFRDRIRLASAVTRIARDQRGVTIRLADGTVQKFDRAILACHADQALALLGDATPLERKILGAFRYQKNVATLHTDQAPMPTSRRAWASWNYRIDETPEGTRASTIYWMNSLQKVSERRDYFVSIDDPGLIDPATVLRTIDYHHPLFDGAAIRAQRELPKLNTLHDSQSTYYCGSYFRYGFHEDAFNSAIDVARTIAKDSPWSRAA